jgi:hypothetical protein
MAISFYFMGHVYGPDSKVPGHVRVLEHYRFTSKRSIVKDSRQIVEDVQIGLVDEDIKKQHAKDYALHRVLADVQEDALFAQCREKPGVPVFPVKPEKKSVAVSEVEPEKAPPVKKSKKVSKEQA